MAMTKCKACGRGVMVHINTVTHIKDGYMVAGDEYRCTCCNEVMVKTRVYQHVNARLRHEETVSVGGL